MKQHIFISFVKESPRETPGQTVHVRNDFLFAINIQGKEKFPANTHTAASYDSYAHLDLEATFETILKTSVPF